MDLTKWALPQLSRLLPLDDESLKQIITYTDTLSRDAAAEHLKNLLGDPPQALEFITNFNSRRPPPPSETPAPRGRAQDEGVPRPKGRQQKKKKNIGQLPPRRVEHSGNISGGYIKKDEEDYMAGTSRSRKEPPLANVLQLQEKPDAKQLPVAQNSSSSTNPQVKLPPSAAGPLISDIPSKSNSRTSSPAPKAKSKVNLSGGTAMRGQSEVLNDLDSAIRALEIQTNPSFSFSAADNAKRRCNCMATRHPLLEAAPNCVNCGKIICVKEGLGPCTFCEKPLLSAHDIQSMVRVLRDERGREKMEANNSAQKRAEVSKAPRAFATLAAPGVVTPSSSDSENEKLAAAKQHRDRLLGFQANNARRTRIHDEAADFETPTAGTSMWASPQERALQLKRQQKVLREQEWASRPEYEKRKVVASIDLAGGRVVRRMEAVQRPESPESEEEIEEEVFEEPVSGRKGGAFSRNPLLGALIRPVAKMDSGDKGKEREREKGSQWRRVQDDRDDNEQWILDGGVYGGITDGRRLGAEEPACG
ncbi:uncharacterized protein K452DRAFT_292956 [Aplosporella prunicola CBS 121167]|uniref:TRIP4/RQT4 C2HC5-type zinc finger domain-containing protein n=1 Tax=Aplosporella prunicola CBS 121167 TaxID=1176127 RepID=A0A6A6AX59_9PEZI|nr:uncharacterized protein K452DRAFT_292956 [Aplosporella prunicola CBS 121167]KAF2135763.1 hypothetical protein K452DRAFT_292956 [Aplosporella prunicola CBS 121167]